MNKKVILFLNGEEPLLYPNLEQYDKVYCTDGSYHYLIQNNIFPDVISGDFDSLELKVTNHNTTVIPTPDQDFTDFEKALKIIVDHGYLAVDVYGGSGKQQDHFIGNLNAACKFKEHLNIQFFDNYSSYYFAEKQTVLHLPVGKTVSLLPFPICKGITTEGLLYPLQNEDLSLTDRIGTRNVTNDTTVKINFESGELILFILD